MNNTNNRLLGMQPNQAGICCYVLGWISGIFFLIVARRNEFVRFHALQSTIAAMGATIIGAVLWFIPIIGPVLAIPFILFLFNSWIWIMYGAYEGERYPVPLAGKWIDLWVRSRQSKGENFTGRQSFQNAKEARP